MAKILANQRRGLCSIQGDSICDASCGLNAVWAASGAGQLERSHECHPIQANSFSLIIVFTKLHFQCNVRAENRRIFERTWTIHYAHFWRLPIFEHICSYTGIVYANYNVEFPPDIHLTVCLCCSSQRKNYRAVNLPIPPGNCSLSLRKTFDFW